MTYTTQAAGTEVLVCNLCGAVVGVEKSDVHDQSHKYRAEHIAMTGRLASMVEGAVSDLNGVIEHFGLEDWELGRP